VIEKKQHFSKEFLHESFLKTGTLNEMTVCLMEFWCTNCEDRFINKELFFYIFERFWGLYGKEFVKNSVQQFLKGNERFTADRENLLFSIENSQALLASIEKFHEREQSIGNSLESQIKFHYWSDAFCYHDYALQHYEKSPSIPREKYSEHQRRLSIARYLMEQCQADGIKTFGEDFCTKLYDLNNVVGISEIKNEINCAFCPGCQQQMDISVYLKLKRFEWFDCPHCGRLFIPVDKPKQYSFADSQNDPEWKIDI
jgi:hypothetical protein